MLKKCYKSAESYVRPIDGYKDAFHACSDTSRQSAEAKGLRIPTAAVQQKSQHAPSQLDQGAC